MVNEIHRIKPIKKNQMNKIYIFLGIVILAIVGMAVLMISSDLPEVLGMSDRIAVMRGGTIVAILWGQSTAHDVMAAALGLEVGAQ